MVDAGRSNADLDRAFDRLGQLLEFPTPFELKIMGSRSDGFAQQIAAIVAEHAPDFKPETMQMRSSSKGNYLSLSVTIQARSREQLQQIYTNLSAHPQVRVVL